MRPMNNFGADYEHLTIREVTAFPVSAFDRLRDNSTGLANWIGALVAPLRKKVTFSSPSETLRSE